MCITFFLFVLLSLLLLSVVRTQTSEQQKSCSTFSLVVLVSWLKLHHPFQSSSWQKCSEYYVGVVERLWLLPRHTAFRSMCVEVFLSRWDYLGWWAYVSSWSCVRVRMIARACSYACNKCVCRSHPYALREHTILSRKAHASRRRCSSQSFHWPCVCVCSMRTDCLCRSIACTCTGMEHGLIESTHYPFL